MSRINKYISNGGQASKAIFEENLATLRSVSPNAIRIGAGNRRLEKALKAAAITKEMRAAQHTVAFDRYLRPAIEACEGSQFTTPLGLAVIYDSINHGSWERIRDRVRLTAPTTSSRPGFEKAWITEYVRRRHEWLMSVPRLRPTAYRTAFFLAQIAQRNWNLDLPFFVHGVALANEHFRTSANSAISPISLPDPPTTGRLPEQAIPANTDPLDLKTDEFQSSPRLDKVQENVDAAAATYDRIEAIARTVITRTDAAKSLWTTIVGTVWQSAWAVASFAIGLPDEVWFGVALIAAALMIFYLYRQLALGKIRETSAFHTMPSNIFNRSEAKADFADKNYE